MREIKALCRIYFINMLSNKFVFIFNLLLPTGYFIFQNHRVIGKRMSFNEQTLAFLSYFWAYIILVTLLNNVIVAIISQRESGFYKQLYFIVGSKWQILSSQVSVHWFILNIELLLFNVVFMSVTNHWDMRIIFAAFLVSVIVSLPIILLSSILVLLPIKIESLNVLTSVLIFGAFLFLKLPEGKLLQDVVTMFNPISYIAGTADELLLGFFHRAIASQFIWCWLIVTLIYSMVGYFSVSKFTVNAVAKRV